MPSPCLGLELLQDIDPVLLVFLSLFKNLLILFLTTIAIHVHLEKPSEEKKGTQVILKLFV